MKTVACKFWVDVPENVTEKEVGDWLKYELHQVNHLSMDNPMSDTEVEAKNIILDFFR